MSSIIRHEPMALDARPMMARGPTAGSLVLIASGLGLAALMTYALSLGGDGWRGFQGRGNAVEVAVFYPDAASWHAVEAAADAAVSAGWVKRAPGGRDELVLTIPRTGRVLRLKWYAPRGAIETRTELERAARSPQPPIAYVGSSNTALTLALARPLRSLASELSSRPGVLLLPGATAVELDFDGDNGRVRQRLVDIYSGRTFRVCLNNSRLASLLVSREMAHAKKAPRVALVIDPADPCSVDFAECIEAAIHREWPDATVRRLSADARDEAGSIPSPAETKLAEAIIDAAQPASADEPLWAVLTIQGDPARRCLAAIESRINVETARRLRVLCGDGLGLASLRQLRGTLSYPLSCAASTNPLETADPVDAQLHLEWIGALVAVLDDAQPAADLADALRGLKLHAGAPNSAGRELAFLNGERQGGNLGSIMTLLPASGRIQAYEPSANGWRTFDWIDDQWRAIASSDNLNPARGSPDEQ